MRVSILFENEQDKLPVSDIFLNMLQNAIECGLKLEGFPLSCEVGLTFTDNERIRELNRMHRKIDRETDVLSFPMLEVRPGGFDAIGIGDYDRDEDGVLLGDIVLSLEKAEQQAAEYGHSFEREASFLCIHSLLHLLGYDHMEAEEQKNMRLHEEAILGHLGLNRDETQKGEHK